jgi:hypothetical protein
MDDFSIFIFEHDYGTSFLNTRKTLLSLGHTVAQLVEALHYNQEGRGFDCGVIGIFH